MNLSEEAREFLEMNEIENYKVNSDGTVDVIGKVEIKTSQSKFPIKFGRVTDDFSCYDTQLTSLEGIPNFISGDYFSCSENNLTSLHDVHKHIKEMNGVFYCYDNPIKDSVLGLFMIKGIYGVYLDHIIVQKIINKHLRQGRAGVISAQQELLDLGLDEYARL